MTRPPTSDSDAIPADIRCAADYARAARERIDPALFAHIDGGAGHGVSASANLASFTGLEIVPRVLRQMAAGHTRCDLGDRIRDHPILLAPLGGLGLLHPQGEAAIAMAAGATRSGFTTSTMASISLEDVAAAAAPDRWFQLYFQPDRAVTLDLVRRAEAAGYVAVVATVDTPIQLPPQAALAAGYRPPAETAPNLRVYPGRAPVEVAAGESAVLQGFMRDAPGWDDLAWLVAECSLPVWVKGILHEDDATEALRRGAAGIVVSNHGGRSLDGTPSSLSCLPAIRQAVGPEVRLILDGGIRSGSDVFKAIALGADAVMIGRLQAYSLAVAGALGVAHMLRLLREELEVTMALAGCATLADVQGATVRYKEQPR